jgi:D-sedoheptulose 7-phosphate isomerase
MQLTETLAMRRISESIAVKQALLADTAFLEALEEVAMHVAEAVRSGHKLMLMGNGGSAADAQHLAAEFTGRYLLERQPLAAMALNVNTSAITAIANDYSFDYVFARQVEALGQAGDVLLGLSTSGNSRNLIAAVQSARKRGILAVGLTGESGGLLRGEVDYCLRVPSTATPRIQECHIMAGHILCEIVECELSA